MEKERLLAFTDGVIAVIITIMVLEMKVPQDASFGSLRSVIPVFLSYVLSASMSPDQLRALLWNISPPGLGGDSYLLDPYGHIVARNRSPGQFAELAPEALRTEIPKQEGMYRGSVDGDTLIVIERPRWLCLWRITWRSAFGRQTTRPDLPEGCPEQFDWSLMRDAWRYNADRRPRIETERLKYGAQISVVRLSSDREIEEFIDASSPAT